MTIRSSKHDQTKVSSISSLGRIDHDGADSLESPVFDEGDRREGLNLGDSVVACFFPRRGRVSGGRPLDTEAFEYGMTDDICRGGRIYMSPD